MTVSTLNSAKRRYHHGDLRAALLAEGLRLVESAGVEAISLREVARGVGVSPTSVYRHFPDKQALMEAIASEALARLGEAQAVAARESGQAKAFNAVGRAYVQFALAHPGLFRVAYTYPGIAVRDPTSEATASILRDLALDLAGGEEARARLIGLRAWSFVHGLAMLMLDGRVPADPKLIDAAIDSAAIDFGGPPG